MKISGKTGLFPVLMLCMLLGACIKENRDNCPVFASNLVFLYTGDGSADIFPNKIAGVEMFVYDSSNSLVEQVRYSKSQLEQYQGAILSLSPGNYDIVCWGNPEEYTVFSGAENFEKARLYQSRYPEGGTIVNFDSLYYGRRMITVEGTAETTDTVRFTSAHINMEVYLEGYDPRPATRAETVPGPLQVVNIPVGYDFRMALTGEESVMYPAYITDQTGQVLLFAFNLLRFHDDTGIIINVLDEEVNVKATVNLREFLRENGISVEGKNEITVPIRIRFEGTYVHVSVAEWNTSEVKPIF